MRSDSFWITSAAWRSASGLAAVPSRIAWAKPWMEVRGVLSSCDTLATNSRCDSWLAFTLRVISLIDLLSSLTSRGPSSGMLLCLPAATRWAAPAIRCKGAAIQRPMSSARIKATTRAAPPASARGTNSSLVNRVTRTRRGRCAEHQQENLWGNVQLAQGIQPDAQLRIATRGDRGQVGVIGCQGFGDPGQGLSAAGGIHQDRAVGIQDGNADGEALGFLLQDRQRPLGLKT